MSEGRRTPERCAGTACGQVCELLGLRASRVHPEEESTCLIPNWFDELCLLSHNLWLSIHIPFSEVQGDVFAIEPYVYHFSLDLGKLNALTVSYRATLLHSYWTLFSSTLTLSSVRNNE